MIAGRGLANPIRACLRAARAVQAFGLESTRLTKGSIAVVAWAVRWKVEA